MSRKDLPERPLVAAAEALDRQLREYAELTDTLAALRLHSEKNLERAGNLMHKVADCEEQLAAHVQALVAAIGQARVTQQAQAERVAEQAKLLSERTDVFKGLLERMRGLGEGASEISRQMQGLTQSGGAEAMASGVKQVQERLGQLAADARTLMDDADREGFADVTKQADSLRQQLESARGRMDEVGARFNGAS